MLFFYFNFFWENTWHFRKNGVKYICFTAMKERVKLNMDKHIEVSILWEIYGKLLTKKQYDVLNDYYNNDLSLSEIAENNKISRQGVRDIIKKGENKLFDYEEKLKIMEKNTINERTIQLVLAQLSKIQENSSDKKVEKILNEVQKELSVMA